MFQGQDVGKGLWHEMPAQVEFSAMHLPLLPIYLEAISGSSCICWQTKIAAFLRATILVSDRGSMPFCWTTTLTSNILLFRATSVEQKKRTPGLRCAISCVIICNELFDWQLYPSRKNLTNHRACYIDDRNTSLEYIMLKWSRNHSILLVISAIWIIE